MEVKQSQRLTFYKIGRRMFVQLEPDFYVFLMPIRPTDGQRLRRIWQRAEQIHDYPTLLTECDATNRVRPVYTQWRP